MADVALEMNEGRFLGLMDKVIGEAEFVQNHPPKVRRGPCPARASERRHLLAIPLSHPTRRGRGSDRAAACVAFRSSRLPQNVPEEDRVIKHCMEVLAPYDSKNGGVLNIKVHLHPTHPAILQQQQQRSSHRCSASLPPSLPPPCLPSRVPTCRRWSAIWVACPPRQAGLNVAGGARSMLAPSSPRRAPPPSLPHLPPTRAARGV